MTHILERLVVRLKKVGVDIELIGNYPWIYLRSVNKHVVLERFLGNHGFTVMFTPVRVNQKEKLTDIKEIFRIIRKYRNIKKGH